MATYRCQIGFQMDSALPRDVFSINPHYSGDNPQALANALKTNLIAVTTIAATCPFTIKVYDATKAPPSYPLATASQTGTPKVVSTPAEVALCLSYYALTNIPRHRGRLYIPYNLITGSLGKRPVDAQLDYVLTTWGNALFKSLPGNHLPVVWSRMEKVARQITNYWVDDEWDTVRSRGFRSTKRVQATLP